jgi:lipopolysaccharide transport system ATP-binding protein
MEDFSGTGRTVLFVSHNMQTINQLCDRAIWLDGGTIADDGDPSTVVSRYLHTAAVSGSTMSWTDDESAPGDGLARLLAVRVVNDVGETVDTTDVRESVGVEIRFRILREGPPLFAKIKVRDRQGSVAFNALDVGQMETASQPGVYSVTAWLPPNLLNEGAATVDVAVCTLQAPKLLPRAQKAEAVSFAVVDPGDGDSARGLFTGQLRGAVRPLLEWTNQRID